MQRKLFTKRAKPAKQAPPQPGTWVRHLSGGSKCGARWELVGSKFYVMHCGHPTALWPYCGVRPDGSLILHPSGKAFQFLRDCQTATAAEAARA